MDTKTTFTFGKYKNITLYDVIFNKKDIDYIKWILSKDFNDDLKFKLKLLLDNYQISNRDKIKLSGPLTSRIKTILSYYDFNELLEKYNITFTTNITNTNKYDFINKLHNISPIDAGCFVDYLIRKILMKKKFNDGRTDCIISCKWFLTEEQQDDAICNIIENNEENDYSFSCIHNFNENNDFWYSWKENLPNYYKSNSNENIFLTSIAHNVFFNRFPEIDIIKTFIKEIKISKNEIKKFSSDIHNIFSQYSKIDCNPTLSTGNITADCDLICDNKIIDIKCQKNNKENENLMQLIGYSVLSKKDINQVEIYNPLLGQIINYDISLWKIIDRNNFFKFLNSD